MNGFRFILPIIFLFSITSLSANGGFYENSGANERQYVVFNFGGADELKSVVDDVEGNNYGIKSTSSTWILKGGEGFVWKNDNSDITSVTLHYRIYKDGTSPPFSNVNLPWNSNIGGNNQKWANYGENIDIIAAVNSSGLWHVEFYYSAATNGVDGIPNPMYFTNSGSNYTLNFTADATLPVSFTEFTGQSEEKQNKLAWTISSEQNTDKYIIERSDFSFSWHKIGQVNATGKSSRDIDYTFIDKNPLKNAYYRLKIVDLDGQYSYSEVLTIKRRLNPMFDPVVFPNPFTTSLNIRMNNDYSQKSEIIIRDLMGKIKYSYSTLNAIDQNTTLNILPNITKGTYFITFKNNDYSFTQKILKL